MAAENTRIKDTRFGIYVNADAMEDFRMNCKKLRLNYSEALRMLIDVFNGSDDAMRRWMAGDPAPKALVVKGFNRAISAMPPVRRASRGTVGGTMNTADERLPTLRVAGGVNITPKAGR